MSRSHECKCKECRPDYFPEVSPRTPGYVNAKFPAHMHPKAITADGEPVELGRVTDVLAGKDGWVIHHTKKPGETGMHRCTCGNGICSDVRWGRVECEPQDEILVCNILEKHVVDALGEAVCKSPTSAAELRRALEQLQADIKEWDEIYISPPWWLPSILGR